MNKRQRKKRLTELRSEVLRLIRSGQAPRPKSVAGRIEMAARLAKELELNNKQCIEILKIL